MTYPLLEKAPTNHNGPDFIPFLRNNNRVVLETDEWIVIENCKYHRSDRKWYTAFAKCWNAQLSHLTSFDHLEWKKKAKADQSVERFHIHMYEN